MAKSKIIKQLANGEIGLEIALKRTKLLLQELNNQDLINWVNSELKGYSKDSDIPPYRKLRGQLRGSYIFGRMKYTNVSIPLGKMEENIKDEFLAIRVIYGIESLQQFVEQCKKNGSNIVYAIPADLYGYIAKCNNALGTMAIISANTEISLVEIVNIFSIVENKLIDILLYLEKEFGTLDDLDIEIGNKTEDELQKIVENINLYIYTDNSITIGNDNKLKNSDIASLLVK